MSPHPQTPATGITRRPFVLGDIGPDGQPQAMLVTPGTETILDQDGARSLIADLLLVLAPTGAGGVAAAVLIWVTQVAGVLAHTAPSVAS
jgi:hypothetical protein